MWKTILQGIFLEFLKILVTSGYQVILVYGQAGGELQVCVIQDRTGDRPPPLTPHEGKLNLFERHWPLPRHLFKVR